MTTIAIKDGIIAADSYIGENGVRSGWCQKIYPHDKGAIAGAGAFGEVLRFRDWIVLGAQPDKQPELKESGVVWVQPDGSVVEYDPSGRIEYAAPFYAMGSGREIAIGAMAAGASAEDAVRIAIEWDAGSGGEVQTLKVGDDHGADR